MPAQPLDGITVVALEQAVAAPFATRQLADLGARVIKVERPGRGDFARELRPRRSRACQLLRLAQPRQGERRPRREGRRGPGPARRAAGPRRRVRAEPRARRGGPARARGATALRARHPRLITCAISGYGDRGPYRDKKAYDLLVQCEAGLLSVTGSRRGAGQGAASRSADIAGGMYALHRHPHRAVRAGAHRRGHATWSVSLLDALGEWMGHPSTSRRPTAGAPPARSRRAPRRRSPRTGLSLPATAPRCFSACRTTASGSPCANGVLGRPELVRDPRFADNPLRRTHDEELTARARAGLRRADTADGLVERAGRGRASPTPGCGDVAELADHPQLAARDRWAECRLARRAGARPAAAGHGGGPQAALRPVPALGEHTDAVRAEFS